MELRDRLLRVIVRCPFDEGESTCPARRHVAHDANGLHSASLAEQRVEILVRRLVGEVPDINLRPIVLLAPARGAHSERPERPRAGSLAGLKSSRN